MGVEVSFVMPSWRPDPSWLRIAVGSVLGEQDVDLELLIVEDAAEIEGPAPDAREVLGPLAADPRVRFLVSPHRSQSDAVNLGVRAASGAFIRYCDTDDAVIRGSTRHLLSLADERTIGYGAIVMCDEQLRPVWTMAADVQGDAVEACLLARFPVRPPGLLFPLEVALAAGEWDPALKICCDWDWSLRAFELARVRGDDTPTYLYRRHGTGLTADVDRGQEGVALVVERWFARHPEARHTQLERRARAGIAALRARVLVTHGRPRAAIPWAARALRADPGALRSEVRRGLPALAGHARRAIRSPAATPARRP